MHDIKGIRTTENDTMPNVQVKFDPDGFVHFVGTKNQLKAVATCFGKLTGIVTGYDFCIEIHHHIISKIFDMDTSNNILYFKMDKSRRLIVYDQDDMPLYVMRPDEHNIHVTGEIPDWMIMTKIACISRKHFESNSKPGMLLMINSSKPNNNNNDNNVGCPNFVLFS